MLTTHWAKSQKERIYLDELPLWGQAEMLLCVGRNPWQGNRGCCQRHQEWKDNVPGSRGAGCGEWPEMKGRNLDPGFQTWSSSTEFLKKHGLPCGFTCLHLTHQGSSLIIQSPEPHHRYAESLVSKQSLEPCILKSFSNVSCVYWSLMLTSLGLCTCNHNAHAWMG